MFRPHRTEAGNRRVATFVVAAALHAAGVVALVAFAPAAVRESLPPIEIKWPQRQPPKQGGGNEAVSKAATPEKIEKRKKASTSITPPPVTETQPIADEPRNEVASADDTGGEGNGDGAGQGDGSGPGEAIGDPNSTCVGPNCTGIPGLAAPVPPGIVPIAIYQPSPPYPASARASGASGLVVVEIIVGTDGRVQSARLVTSRPLFDAAALATVRKWRYQPIVVGGHPIVWKSNVSLRFQLR